MSDKLIVDVDTREIEQALLTLGDFAQSYVDAASLESALSIDAEASSRLHRQLGPNATGRTVAGIVVYKADGSGYIVESTREPMPNLPLWLEKGTKKGSRRGGSGGGMAPRPYFWISALLEEGDHERRIADALADAFAAQGLGG